jgi:hypothetical protein
VTEANLLLALVEFKKKARRSYQQSLDLALVRLICHHVERKVLELEWVVPVVVSQTLENVSATDVTGTAHGVVGHVDTFIFMSPVSQIVTGLG